MSVCVADCPPLGMESHKIEPDQLSASSMSQYSFSPQRARLNMQVYTTHWPASLNTLQQSLTYIQALQWAQATKNMLENTVIALYPAPGRWLDSYVQVSNGDMQVAMLSDGQIMN